MAGKETSKVARLRTDCVDACDRACASMRQAATALAEKRVTLEEKMITNYFQGLTDRLQSFREVLGPTCTPDDAVLSLEEPLSAVTTIAREIDETTQELLHKIRYNLNYLEQYYEHDFYDRLAYEHRYEERLEDATRALKSILGMNP